MSVESGLKNLNKRARLGIPPDQICAMLERIVYIPVLPKTLQKLLSITPNQSTIVAINFLHCKPFDIILDESYSFEIKWENDTLKKGASISELHFSIKESVVENFFPLDSKTMLSSNFHFPFSLEMGLEKIPDEDLEAMIQYKRMKAMLQDEEFETRILKDLINIFN